MGQNGPDRINVEVTTLSEKSFNKNTLKNSLAQKRKQLPDTDPAAIVIALPQQWVGTVDVERHVYEESEKFFRSSRRANAIIFLRERLHVAPLPSILLVDQRVMIHPDPRLKLANEAIFTQRQTAIGMVRDSEFFRWVNYIVGDFLPELAPTKPIDVGMRPGNVVPDDGKGRMPEAENLEVPIDTVNSGGQWPLPPTQGVTQLTLAMNVHEVVLTVGVSRASMQLGTGGPAPVLGVEWLLSLSMPPSLAKVLQVNLEACLKIYEERFGKIPTDNSAGVVVTEAAAPRGR